MKGLPGPRRVLLAAAGIAALVLAGQFAGCSSPSPLTPPGGTEGPCDFPAIFTPLSGGLTTVGTDTTLDIATWNLEFFPLRLPGNYRCPHPLDEDRQTLAADLINVLGLDIIAVEEISDPTGFQETMDLCPNYAGIAAPEERGCNYQRPGIVYRTDQVTIHDTSLIFTDDTFAFPRSPFVVDLTVTSNGRSYDLILIVVHLKASTDAESFQRRRAASAALKGYLDERAEADSTVNYMVAGDWNGRLDTSSFPAFVNAPEDYQFLDKPMEGLSAFASHPASGGSLIDHIMVNKAACPDFSDGRVTTFRLDLIVNGYDNISDHRPVMVAAPVFR